jgi:hypothetical protein
VTERVKQLDGGVGLQKDGNLKDWSTSTVTMSVIPREIMELASA